MSNQRAHPIGIVLIALILAACQGSSGTPEAASRSATAVPTASPTASPTAEATPSASPVVTQWEQAGNMSVARDDPHAIALADGSVLVVGNDQGAEIHDASGAWSTVASLDKPRTNFSLVRLHDGRAMVVGGMNDIDQSYLSALLFDPAAPDDGWVHASGLLHTARTDPSVVVLADGRVLVAGGYFRVAPDFGRVPGDAVLASYGRSAPRDGGLADVAPPSVGAAMATAELFDPATEEWTETGPMTYARYAAAATLLADGRVLVVGSQCPNYGGEVTVDYRACGTAEIYDPATGRFTLTGSLPELDLTGYDFPHDRDSTADPPPAFMGTLVPLPDGGAVLIGKYGSWHLSGTVIRSFRFDVDGSWRQIGDAYVRWPIRPPGSGPWEPPTSVFVTENVVARFDPLVGQLPDGRVVVAGGDSVPETIASVEVYDPDDDAWTSLPSMPEPRAAGAAVTVPDGSILVVGGHHQHEAESGVETSSLASAVRLVVGSPDN